jgi:V8-like Glu-specific endopeptidase
LSCVGLLQVIWYDGESCSNLIYSTAFAISPRVIVTCAHNVYDSTLGECSSAIFIPVHGVATKADIYRTHAKDFVRKEITPNDGYHYAPTRSDYAVLILERPLDRFIYLNVGRNMPFEEDNHSL